MQGSIKKFDDAAIRPPSPGGWHYYLEFETRSGLIKGSCEEDVFKRLRQYRKNNNTFTTEYDLQSEVWAYWRSLQPHRCGPGYVQAEKKEPMPLKAGDPEKEKWGPWCWNFLNWAAVNFNAQFFFDLVNELLEKLIVCNDCRAEFAELVRLHPPWQIQNAFGACQWVNMVHNKVNARVGSPQFSYNRMIREFGAPLPPTQL